jgi:hypothetical protein
MQRCEQAEEHQVRAETKARRVRQAGDRLRAALREYQPEEQCGELSDYIARNLGPNVALHEALRSAELHGVARDVAIRLVGERFPKPPAAVLRWVDDAYSGTASSANR